MKRGPNDSIHEVISKLNHENVSRDYEINNNYSMMLKAHDSFENRSPDFIKYANVFLLLSLRNDWHCSTEMVHHL